MTRHRNALSNERGFALFYMAVFLTVLLIFVGLAVDTGRAYVVQAQLSKADLSDAELYLADLRGTDLSQALGLVQAQLEETCGDKTTKLPADLAPPPSWPCASAGEND